MDTNPPERQHRATGLGSGGGLSELTPAGTATVRVR